LGRGDAIRYGAAASLSRIFVAPLQSSLCADFRSAELLLLNIIFKELQTVPLLVRGKQFAGHLVLLFVDNTRVVQLLKHGTPLASAHGRAARGVEVASGPAHHFGSDLRRFR
jgi:hypothetical protein